MLRRNSSNEPHPHHAHSHDHTHNEIDEALKLSETTRGRKKLLVAGLANAAIMAAAGWTTFKSGAAPTAIESIHDLGDMGYYLVPWFATMHTHLHSREAIKWMRGTSYFAGTLATISMASSVHQAVSEGVHHPEAFSAPAQAAFAIANAGIAVYVGKETGSTVVDKAALRHAKNDARTSVVAGLCNTAAIVSAPFNPLGSVLVGGMTIATERTNIKDATQALSKPTNQPRTAK